MLLGVQTSTKTLHVLAKLGRFPLQLSWRVLAGEYLERLEKMDADRMLKQAFIADCSLPACLSWRSLLEAQLENHLVPSPTEDHPAKQPSRRPFLLNLPSVGMWSSCLCRLLARLHCTEASSSAMDASHTFSRPAIDTSDMS